MATTIAFTNLKGGSGKTSTVINTAYALMKMGVKVLVVDCDPQGNASMTLGKISPLDAKATIGDVFAHGSKFCDLISKSKYPGIDLVASNLNVVADLAALPPNSVRRAYGFRNALDEKTSADYDYILLDCPPSIDGAPLVNSMIIADYAVIPVDGVYALAGVHPLLESIRTIRDDAQTNLTILGILITQQDGRTNESKGLKSAIIGGFGKDFVFQTHIPRNATVKESQMVGKAICDEKHKSPGCAAYTKFTSEMLTRISKDKKRAA